jgi:hypothetical protein
MLRGPALVALCIALYAASPGCGESTMGSTGSGGDSGGTASAGSGGNSGGVQTTGGGGSAGNGGAPGVGGTSEARQADGLGGAPGGDGTTGSEGSHDASIDSGGTGESIRANDAGGTLGAGSASPESGASPRPTCTFTQASKTSSKIGTVGIVTWSTSLAETTSAEIEFGLDTSYGMTAPVTTPTPGGSNTTLLLGMKQKRRYHYRISASSATASCTSDDYTIETGALPSGMPQIKVTTKNASALYGGFLLTGRYVVGAAAATAPAYVLDADGDVVWAYVPGSEVLGAVMSYDGRYMWINSNSFVTTEAHVHQVSMDGLVDQDLSDKFAGLNHQLTILPDETVAFYAYGSNGCEDIKEYSPSGMVRTIANAGTAQGVSGGCHLNNIQYSNDDDTLVFSDLYHQSVVKVRRSDGSTVWVLNGSKSTFTGDSWRGGQHGIHILGPDDFVMFHNNTRGSNGGPAPLGGSGNGSSAVEFKLDLIGKKASKVWSYKANPGVQSDILGDVQRLPNGNTIVGYSYAGVVHEVAADGTLLQQLSWPSGNAFGYIQKRATLYGPPPR